MASTDESRSEAAILQSLPAEIAVLDRDGTILRVNAAWNTFARENGAPELAAGSEGWNYLAVCDQAIQEQAEHALEARTGLEAVLAGRLPRFLLEYPCHSPQKQRWFLLDATPLHGEPGKAVVTHLDITQHKQLERLATTQDRSDFLRLVTHEIRTPLTSLGGYAQLAQRHLEQLLRAGAAVGLPGTSLEESVASLRQDLDQVRAQAKRLNRLITNLAEVAQTPSGTLPLPLERVDREPPRVENDSGTAAGQAKPDVPDDGTRTGGAGADGRRSYAAGADTLSE